MNKTTKNIKKITALAAALAATIGILSGCAGKKDDASATADNSNVPLEHVYTETDLPIDGGRSASSITYSNERIYFARYMEEKTDDSDETLYYQQLVSDSLDGGDEKIIKSWRNEQYGPGATVMEQTSLSTFGIAADGTL
ncbi:MAG: hypothetical protein LBN00_07240, partial [Oscillospiraceae bacterium]|nr:hypothetical protein [Oscillospiraceae bacterium]